MKIWELKEYDLNAKKHSQDQIAKLAESIKRFGFNVPIVIDSKNEIVAGHGRLEAARLLGFEDISLGLARAKVGERVIPAILVDDLSEDEIKAYRLADNKLNESDWIGRMVNIEIKALPEDLIKLTGFESKIDLGGSKEKPEVRFSEELLEEHNFVVLYFDNEIDWLNLKTMYPLDTVKALDSKEGFEKKGIGRVVRGTDFINKIKQS